jgi:hypothetical protein
MLSFSVPTDYRRNWPQAHPKLLSPSHVNKVKDQREAAFTRSARSLNAVVQPERQWQAIADCRPARRIVVMPAPEPVAPGPGF